MPNKYNLLSAGIIGVFAPLSSAAGIVTQPNIILILADDLGAGDLSCLGAEDICTPNIDRLFETGMSFSSCYSNSNVSSPSRAAILTGRYPDLVGVQGVIRSTIPHSSWGYLSQEAELLPELLKKKGYETAIVGKWNLGSESPNLPNERGFDLFKGFLDDMMDNYYHHKRHGVNFMRQNNDEIDPYGHATDLFTQWAIDYIEDKDRISPYFLYLAYNAPHLPLQPPKEWEDNVLKRESGVSLKRAKLIALIEHLDYNIGQIISKLEQTGQIDNTVIIFTSDNGGDHTAEATCGAHRGYKGEMYDGGLAVPLAVYWKGHVEKKSSDRFVTLADIYPTLCDYLGYEYSDRVDGISVLPLLEGMPMETGDRYVVWVRREYQFGGKSQFAIRYKNYKLLQNNPLGPCELFDLESDPLETRPLSDTVPIYKDLIKKLSAHYMKAGHVPFSKE